MQPKSAEHEVAHRPRNRSSSTARRRLAGDFRQLQPLRSHLSEDGARLVVGRNLRQLYYVRDRTDALARLSAIDLRLR